MLCYNCRWGETSTARKQFDSFMRQILFDMKNLVALRSWCGILREKTVVDVAMARAQYLTVLNLGTMVPKVSEQYFVCYFAEFFVGSLIQIFNYCSTYLVLQWFLVLVSTHLDLSGSFK